MIHLHIYTDRESDALDIARALLVQHYCIDCKIETNRLIDAEGIHTIYEVNAVSKFLLYQTIEQFLHQHFNGKYRELFSLPIVQVNDNKREAIPVSFQNV